MFGKKRGHRHTGSKALGSAGEALFFALMLAAGTAFLVLLLAKKVVPEWRANHEFQQLTASALDKRVGETRDGDGNAVYRPEVKIRYELDGDPYEIWTYDVTGTWSNNFDDVESLVDQIQIGREYLCWYDPLQPGVAVIARGYSWWFWMMLLVPSGFILIGGAGLIYTLWHWGKSPEHRAAQGELGNLELFEDLDIAAKEYPTVPHDENLTNSPGTKLKYRLPSDGSQGWRLFAATTACLIWNGIVVLFVVIAVRAHLRGEPDWWLDAFVAPFLLAGALLIYYFIRALLIATGVGPTQIEISDHPLWPGHKYEVHISQTGNLSMQSFQVLLECEEVSAYRQGTDTRTDRSVVYRQPLHKANDFDILPGSSHETHCEMAIPDKLMHSFKSDHNEVQWKLVVRGMVTGWPSFERSFPVVICPPQRATNGEAATLEGNGEATA